METDQKLVTFAEYMKLPDPDESLVLHHGRVVKRPIHTLPECDLKNHIDHVFGRVLGKTAFASLSIGYQPLPEYELWVAGNAVVPMDRWKDGLADEHPYLQGSPEIIIEIIGPSLTMEEIEDERDVAMRTGCRQFWIVNEDERTVHVTDTNGRTCVYSGESSIPLPECWAGTVVPLSEIFRSDRY
jgi:hypothetical protein